MLYRLGDLLQPTKILNTGNRYEPVAVGKYGIRKRSEIYKKQLAEDYSKNRVISYGDLIIGMGSTQIDVGVLCTDETYCVSPAYHTYHIDTSVVSPDYLEMYIMANNDLYTKRSMIASARQGKSVNLKGFMEEFVEVPTFSTQKALVSKIKTVREAITNQEHLVSELDACVKSLFDNRRAIIC